MSNHVLGRKITVEMFDTDDFYRVTCGKTMEFVSDIDMIEVTTRTSPNAREFLAGLSNATLSVTGITTTTNGTGSGKRLSPLYLLEESIRRTRQQFRITFLDQDALAVTVVFYGLIKTVSISRDILQWSQSSLNIQVTGALTIDPVAPPETQEFEILSDWWETVPGNDFVDVDGVASIVHGYTLTADDIVLEIDREGTEYNIVTGTPANRQARFNTSNLRVEFIPNPALPFVSGETIFVLFKRPV